MARNYLEDAAFYYRQAARTFNTEAAAHDMQIGDRLAALAAIERGLLPDQVATILAEILGAGEGSRP